MQVLPLLLACGLFYTALLGIAGTAGADDRSDTRDNKAPRSTAVTDIPTTPPPAPRTDLLISGVYPHLTTYGIYSQNGAHFKEGHNECGIGAIVPWAGKLWMVNYAPHMPRGSEHKLYSVDPDLTKPLTIYPESVGGTPAGRMIHQESRQLLIGHHLIDAKGHVRTIDPRDMPIRVTAIARHLDDPENLVYYIDMEGSIWEANVHTLAVKQRFQKPVPGWHGKGGYTSQRRLVVSNNGELKAGSYDALLTGGAPTHPEQRGVLAEFDGTRWRIVERRQFTEVTGPKGITGGSDGDDPLWAMGWDRRSIRLKLLDHGQWYTYLLPKAAYCNDAQHGWYTEWPRIREITDGRWMMDMHGMFFDFPKTFSRSNSAGIRPIGSHLRYVPDFCQWNQRLVLATDETSIQGNPLAGQPQSNLWFGTANDLKNWGPSSAYGGPWIEDEVQAQMPSDPFLVDGFDRRIVHLAIGKIHRNAETILRSTDQLPITQLPESLATLPRVSIARGDWHKPSPGFEFSLSQPATVYLAVDGRGQAELPPQWKLTPLVLEWGRHVTDRVFVREFAAGKVAIPGNSVQHSPGAFGLPHMAFVQLNDASTDDASTDSRIVSLGDARVQWPSVSSGAHSSNSAPVRITIQIDRHGKGIWDDYDTISVGEGQSVSKILPQDFQATWLRFVAERDCVATAFLHQTTGRYVDGNTPENKELFAGIADIGDEADDVLASLVYPAKRNRNLRLITSQGDYFDFTKASFTFEPDQPDAGLENRLRVQPEFTVDDASVVIQHQGKRLRLPKGNAAFDVPFASGWPRAAREVESERVLANIHGTFYEVPLVTNGDPPAWNLLRPVSSHAKQITDFCSWNGLLVLAGVRLGAVADGHVFRDANHNAGLWFGGIDDLWKLGKPIGHGGPWLNTEVTPGIPSDPYLMKGYDQMSVTISHQSPHRVAITLQIDLDGNGLWVDYQRFDVPGGQSIVHDFQPAFSACWVRAISNTQTTATVQFDYR